MIVLFHPAAREELRQAAEWYEDRRPGLGDELIAAVEGAVAFVRETPERWPAYPDGARSRRYLIRRFPFSVNYVVAIDSLFIAAVAHLNRRPGYWARRLADAPRDPEDY